MILGLLGAAAPFGIWAMACLAEHCISPVPVRILNAPDPVHLIKVETEMIRRGRPSIRAFRTGDGWTTIEGSHRVSAAARLGCGIEIIEVNPGEIISNHDVISVDTGLEFGPLPADELVRSLGSPEIVRLHPWKIALRKHSEGRS